jgi:hypothetical protein
VNHNTWLAKEQAQMMATVPGRLGKAMARELARTTVDPELAMKALDDYIKEQEGRNS